MTDQNFALVRDKEGNPRFDDWNNIHEGHWAMLTEKEKEFVLTQRSKK